MASSTPRNDDGASRRSTGFEGLVRELSTLSGVTRANKTASLAELKSEIAEIIHKDYGQALRRCLSRWEVGEIADEGKARVWPGLNRDPVKLVSPHEFVRRWSSLGVDFKFASLSWKEGLSLLGFYVNKIDRVRTRPLIFVNTAHHPAVVGVALDHEMGHHLTSQIFAAGDGPHLLPQTGFEEHLAEPTELAADILVSLGMFPAPIARTLFKGANRAAADNPPNQLSDAGFAKILQYVGKRYGFRLDHIRGVNKRFQTLAGLVHYAKLRRALLDEYNI
jgi:hypothetical protein